MNAMVGLWARSTEVVDSVRSSSSELDSADADSQAFAYEGAWCGTSSTPRFQAGNSPAELGQGTWTTLKYALALAMAALLFSD